jgi:hypothetical protein
VQPETLFTAGLLAAEEACTTPYLFDALENGARGKKGLELSETPQFDKKASKKRNLNRGLLYWNADKKLLKRRR